jgi:UDP-galactopyranose mutase
VHPDESYDLLIVGAGPVGCVVAERAASQRGWSSLVIDRRDHLAGNCYDRAHESGVLIHQYGPHYFRTNSADLLSYLSQFTEWVEGHYIVKSLVDGKLYPMPINLTTLEMFFGASLDEASAKDLLEHLVDKIDEPKNSEELVLSRVGRELYEAFYLGYTLKQWGQHPRELEASVCGRVPVRCTRDERYVDHEFQVTPKDGFTALFAKMIEHPKITLRTGTDYDDVKGLVKPKRATIYCGAIDEYFDCRFGALDWRSLRFDFKFFDENLVQPCVQINYPSDHEYSRTVEIKHVTRQEHRGTVVSYEYPMKEGEAYYPVPTPEGAALYQKYKKEAERETREKGVYFVGRLAEYAYINTDEAIEKGLAMFERLVSERS